MDFRSLNDVIIKHLKENNFKNIKDKDVESLEDYYINKQGDIIRIVEDKRTKIKQLKSIPKSKNKFGYKVNISINGKGTSKQLANLVYRTFRGDYEGDLFYIDGDKFNCNLDNLITVNELLDFYRENKY